MTKLLIGVLSLALLGTGVLVGVAAGSTASRCGRCRFPAARPSKTQRPRRTGGPRPAPPRPETTTAGAGDISGPCDEVEHRNDSRCTGAAPDDDREDNSGSGSDDDDRSGSNSGRG